MSIYIFTGSTLRPGEGQKELHATYLPPASQGDVYRAALTKPFAIGIIDGYFDRVPAVWHKEILWAMAQGVHVFGAASMGALRAAELAPFGMEGIGWIYEAFRDGVLEDDDEVAVVHDETYTPLSEAMVNIRVTLEKAQNEDIITSSTHSVLTETAKRLFYPERTYRRLLMEARQLCSPSQELCKFEQWLASGQIDQKRDDAIAMLRAIRHKAEHDVSPKSVDYCFENTYGWERLRHEAGKLRTTSALTQTVFTDSVLEELKLKSEAYATAMGACLNRYLARESRIQINGEMDEVSLLETVVGFRERYGLQSSADLAQWLRRQQLGKEEFLQLMREENTLRLAQSAFAEPIERLLPSYLQLTGQYSSLADRAMHKFQILSAMDLENPTADDIGLTDGDLLKWYFRDRFQKAHPKRLANDARRLGFSDEGSFLRAVRREKCYVMHLDEQNQPTHAQHTQAKKRKRAIKPKRSRT